MKLIIISLLCNLLTLTCTYFGIVHLNIILFIILISFSVVVIVKYRQVCLEKKKIILEHKKLLDLMNEISNERLQFLLNKQEAIKND